MLFEHIYIDMDGVLCDLVKGVLAEHGRMDLYPMKGYLTERALGLSRDKFWEPVINAGAEFWAELKPYPWTYDLLSFANKIACEVTILTKPLVLEGADWNFIETGQCVQGKLQWLHEHTNGAHAVIFTDKKNTVSKPRVLLIDDDEAYENAFVRAGGRQFIWPQPYNRYKQFMGKEMETIMDWYTRVSGGETVP